MKGCNKRRRRRKVYAESEVNRAMGYYWGPHPAAACLPNESVTVVQTLARLSKAALSSVALGDSLENSGNGGLAGTKEKWGYSRWEESLPVSCLPFTWFFTFPPHEKLEGTVTSLTVLTKIQWLRSSSGAKCCGEAVAQHVPLVITEDGA